MSYVSAGTWSFAGISLAQQRIVDTYDLDGPFTPPPPKGSNIDLENESGEDFIPKLYSARRLMLGVRIFSGTVASYALIDQLNAAFAASYSALQPLVHNHPDGGTRTAQAEVVDVRMAPANPGKTVLWQAAIDFNLPDPLFYGAPVTVSGASPFDATNPGNVPLDRRVANTKLTFAIKTSVNPQIVNHTTGDRIAYAGKVDGSKVLNLHAHAQTAQLAGLNPVRPFRHASVRRVGAGRHRGSSVFVGGDASPASVQTADVTVSTVDATNWLTLPSGLNHLELIDDSGLGTVDFTFIPAYY